MTLKIAGQITPRDSEILDQLIATQPDVKAEWERLIGEHSPQDLHTYLARYEMLDWVPASEITRKETSGNYRPILIAAAVIGVLALALVWIFNTREQPSLVVNNSTTPAKAVSLKLANGQEVALSANGDTISLAGTQLNNTGSTLSFQSNAGNAGINHLSVPAGMTYRLVLPDGTQIWLNSDTDLDFPFAFDNKREISIRGEAYLEVAPDAAIPFIVKVAGGEVEVLGTSFNINAYTNTRVALVSGKVKVKSGQKQLLLKPGEESVADASGRLAKYSFDEEETLAWRKGMYYFNNVKLIDMLPVLTRMYGIQIKVDNASLQTTTFSGLANRNKPVRVFLDNLVRTAAIDYYIAADSTLHFK